MRLLIGLATAAILLPLPVMAKTSCGKVTVELSEAIAFENEVTVHWPESEPTVLRGGQFRVLERSIDLDGMGRRAIIVEEWSGGAHCCYSYHFIEASGAPVDSLYVGDGQVFDVNLPFSLQGDRFVPDMGLLRTERAGDKPPILAEVPWQSEGEPEVTAGRLAAQLERRHADRGELLNAMLELIFTGHADAAWQLYDRVGVLTRWEPLGGFREARATRQAFIKQSRLRQGHSQTQS